MFILYDIVLRRPEKFYKAEQIKFSKGLYEILWKRRWTNPHTLLKWNESELREFLAKPSAFSGIPFRNVECDYHIAGTPFPLFMFFLATEKL